MSQLGESTAVTDELESEEFHWSTVEYTYGNGAPVEGEFCAVDSEGREWRGRLNDRGEANLSLLPEGNVSFELVPAEEQEIDALRAEIKQILDAIVEEQRAEAAALDAELAEQSRLGRAGSYVGAVAEGFWNGAVGLVSFAWDVVKTAAEVAAFLNPVERMNNALSAAWRSYQAGELTQEEWRRSLLENYQDEEFKDLAELLGFDVRDLTPEKIEEIKQLMAEAYEVTAYIADDPETLEIFEQFAKDYAGAQSSIEWAEFAGGGVFEIVLTALLLAFTGGLGNIAQVGSKIRHATRLRTLGHAIRRLGRALRRMKLRRQVEVNTDVRKPVRTELPDEVPLRTRPVRRLPEEDVPCFRRNPKHDPVEFERQLGDQQKGLNNMSAQEYLDGRRSYTGDRASTAGVRRRYQQELARGYRDADPTLSRADAAAQAADAMRTLNALHNPDGIAGGRDVISGFGDAGVNKSIGSQWKTRLDALDDAAEAAIARGEGDFKMNASLKPCP